jgi:translation initiation factor 2 gamma subunit (eIF-2gamma)
MRCGLVLNLVFSGGVQTARFKNELERNITIKLGSQMRKSTTEPSPPLPSSNGGNGEVCQ